MILLHTLLEMFYSEDTDILHHLPDWKFQFSRHGKSLLKTHVNHRGVFVTSFPCSLSLS